MFRLRSLNVCMHVKVAVPSSLSFNYAVELEWEITAAAINAAGQVC